MSYPRGSGDKKQKPVIVAIDKDKGSQSALRWAVENLLGKGTSVTLLHVKQKPSSNNASQNDDHPKLREIPVDNQVKELFLPFRCFCTRKDIHVNEVAVEETDIARALCEYARTQLTENLVIGASVKSYARFKSVDTPGNVSKWAPDFCTVHVISKGKVASIRSASSPVPKEQSPSSQNTFNPLSSPTDAPRFMQGTSPTDAPRFMQGNGTRGGSMDRVSVDRASIDRSPFMARASQMEDMDPIKSPFTRMKNSNRSYENFQMGDTDISFVSSTRPGSDRMNSLLEHDMMLAARQATSLDADPRLSFGISGSANRISDSSFGIYSSSSSGDSGNYGWSGGQTQGDIEAEMARLKQELRQTMDLYSTACREALTAKQKAMELSRWKVEEQQKLEEARQAEEAALAIAEREKERCKIAIAKAEAAQKIAELEAQRRIHAERKARQESEEKNKVLDKLANNDVRYRRYSLKEIEIATDNFAKSRKIGEGGYGPVYKGHLDHTEVAIKILRPDAAQGRSQFQQEIEVLSCIRHPNMVLLLGACPDHGCLVYEYMANGSLDDLLFRPGSSQVLSWQVRFRISAEIATALLFLHQAKPEPLVHRDLKPGNILIDRNFVSKISDVGLARLVPPTVADTVTQYHMTSAAGTFCYIDPEYQQTGMLGVKSDVYSLGVMLLQIITAKPPMGLTHHVERSIEKGTFAEMLDPAVPEWPLEEALSFAKLALKCAELRRKDRPDLGNEVLPELDRLRVLAEDSMQSFSPIH